MTKAEIVEAALKVWGRQLYLNTSLSQVAGELGVSKAALYRHFLNKKALLEAMTAHFFDDLAEFIRPAYRQALENRADAPFIVIDRFAEYYARNVHIFIFSMVNIYSWKVSARSGKELRNRGIDLGVFHRLIGQDYIFQPTVMSLIFASLTFFVADFHKKRKSFDNAPDGEAVLGIIARTRAILAGGLGYERGEIDALDFDALEKHVTGTVSGLADDPLLKAVAKAVAAAGPWAASMEMVAHCSGLSKSSLYSHFKNKQDMLRQLFMTEFSRIIDFARQSMEKSAAPEQQLYLGIFSIVVYLRSKPEILTAIDWIRTRGLDLGKPESDPELFRIFGDINIKSLQYGGGGGSEDESGMDESRRKTSHWILFLIINILMRKTEKQKLKDVPDNDIRILFRFLTLGMKGLKE